MHFIRLNTTLSGNEADWTFIGVPKWKQDQEGVLYPPVWYYSSFDPDPVQIPNHCAHELARGSAPAHYSVVPDWIVQTGPKTRQEWYQSSPHW